MSRQVFRFGDCTIDIAARELRRGGAAVAVPPRSLECIGYLVLHRDRAVGRDELISAVWGRASVSDTMLGKTILAARRALGDSADDSRFIRTVSRFGYKWVADTVDLGVEPVALVPVVATDGEDAAQVVDAPGAESTTPGTVAPALPRGPSASNAPWRFRMALAIAGLVGASVLGAAYLARTPHVDESASVAVPARTALTAVLPVVIAGGEADAWLRLGLMDLLAERLRHAGVAALPSESVLRLLPGELSADAATQLLQSRAGVSDVIGASVRRAGSTWVVRATRTSTSGNAQAVEAHAADPLLAANDVADRLLALFGKSARASVAAEPSLTELMQRTEAARLGDDLVGARRLIEAAPPSLQRMPEVRLRLAQIDIRAGRFEAALSELHALLDELSAEAEPVLRAQAFYATATALLRTDRYDDALHAFDAGVALADLGGDASVAARLHMGRGSLEAMTRHYDAALADYARARIAYQLSGDAFTVAWLDGNEGVLQLHRDRPADAVPALARAEQHFERFGVFNELVTMQGDQIVAQLALLQPAAALAAGERAAPFLDRVRDASVRRLVQLRQALASIANGRTREARARLDALLQQVDPVHDLSIRGVARLALAQLDLAAGRPTDALAGATQAIDDLLLPDDEADRALAWATRLRALRANHDLAGLRAADSGFDAWKNTRTAPLARLRVTMADAEQAAFDGDDAAARRHYDAALVIANDIATPAALAEVAVDYGELLIRDGRLEEASVVAGRVARFASDDFGCALLQAHLYVAMGHQAAAVEALAEARRLAGERPVSALATAPVVAAAPH